MTWVFTFDSLGNNHPQVGRVLKTYLKSEAKDKKAMDNTTVPEFKKAAVR